MDNMLRDRIELAWIQLHHFSQAACAVNSSPRWPQEAVEVHVETGVDGSPAGKGVRHDPRDVAQCGSGTRRDLYAVPR